MPTISELSDTSNFAFLLVALLMLLLGLPIAEDLSVADLPIVRAWLVSLLLAIGIWSLKGGGMFFTIGMVFAVTGILLTTLALNTDSAYLLNASRVTLFGFLSVAFTYAFGKVAFGTEMSFNRLLGAICVYLLLGTIWALLYLFVELLSPGSFNNIEASSDRGLEGDWVYFSFVTMTTLGYGDVAPLSATARALAYMQAVFGQFYIAILVAGLVGGYISDQQNEQGAG